MKSTQAMRDRIRELMSHERDDYDRAVECVLDDLESILCRTSLEREAIARELCRQDIPWNWQGKDRDAWVEIEWKGYLKKADAILAITPSSHGARAND